MYGGRSQFLFSLTSTLAVIPPIGAAEILAKFKAWVIFSQFGHYYTYYGKEKSLLTINILIRLARRLQFIS
jgi:hypothetical protein